MKFLNWLIKKLEGLREKLADRYVIKTLKKHRPYPPKKTLISLGCNEADLYGINL